MLLFSSIVFFKAFKRTKHKICRDDRTKFKRKGRADNTGETVGGFTVMRSLTTEADESMSE